MAGSQTSSKTQEMEKAAEKASKASYTLKLYVAGLTPRSTRAISNIRKLCEEHLKGRYTLEVIDIYKNPSLAEGEQIIAAPTLLKQLPLPLKRFIGEMSDKEKILVGLDLAKTGNAEK